MKFDYLDFFKTVAENSQKNPSWRLGQSVWNTAQVLYGDAVEEFRGTALDPFHNDGLIDAFVGALAIKLNG